MVHTVLDGCLAEGGLPIHPKHPFRNRICAQAMLHVSLDLANVKSSQSVGLHVLCRLCHFAGLLCDLVTLSQTVLGTGGALDRRNSNPGAATTG